MPARPLLPDDDLYARLEIPVDASYEAIEVAWRALLRQRFVRLSCDVRRARIVKPPDAQPRLLHQKPHEAN